MFKKKKVEEEEVVVATQHANPHSDPVCDGCGKPITNVQVRNDGRSYHNQYCFNADERNN